MAGKLAIAAGGFMLGAATTLVVTESLREAPSTRATTERTIVAPPPPPSPTHAEEDAGPETPPRADLPLEQLAEEFLRRIEETERPGPVLQDLVALGHKASHDVLLAIYSRLRDDPKRVQAALAVASQRGPYILDILDLLANEHDYDARMQGLRRLREYALIDFEEHPDAYPAWRARTRDLSLREAAILSARELGERLRTLQGDELLRVLNTFPRPAGHFPVLRDAGLLPVFEELLRIEVPGADRPVTDLLRSTTWNWIESMRPDEEFLRRVALPLARGEGAVTPEGSARALGVLARSRLPWVFDVLVDALRRARATRSYSWSIGGAFAEYGDRRAIPHLIAAIAADPRYETIYGLGYFGLGKLTGVRYDRSHDGDWWLAWWDRNKEGLPDEVRAIDPRRLR